ncbi:MAG: SDR family NAD(P)-dependent oxidoreductase [Woeseiaceae bacterium]
MSLLPSLTPGSNVAVIGASGGIGRAFTELLGADSAVAKVHAFARSPVSFDSGVVASSVLDFADEASVRQAAETATQDGPLDLVIVATGILHRDPDIRPEKTMRELDSAALAEVFAVNTIGPALVAKHFLPTLRRGAKTVFAALSARVGSITDNRLGGWASYRMSKAALNMMLRTMAIEQARLRPDSILVALHPGTVDTGLSAPFQTRVPDGKLFTPHYSASRLLEVLDQLQAADSGGFFAYDGSRIEF